VSYFSRSESERYTTTVNPLKYQTNEFTNQARAFKEQVEYIFPNCLVSFNQFGC
jgi:hypothetical protein